MAMNNYQWQSDRVFQDRSAGVHDGTTSNLFAQLEFFNKRFENDMTQPPPQYNQEVSAYEYYDDCGGDYYYEDCPSSVEPVQYLGVEGQNQDNLHFNAYNSGWGNSQELYWENNSEDFSSPLIQTPTPFHGFSASQRPHYHQVYFDTPPPQQEKKSSLEDMLSQYLQNSETIMRNQTASIKALEIQVGQLVNEVRNRPSGSLPSDSEPNLRGESSENHEVIELINEDEIDKNPKTEELEKEEDEQIDQSKEEESMPMSNEALVSTPHIEHYDFVFKVAGEPKPEEFCVLEKLLNQAHAKTSTHKEQINCWQHARRLQPFWEATANPPRLSLFVYQPP